MSSGLSHKKIDWDRLKFGFCVFLWSLLGSFYGQPLIHENQDAVNVIVTVFSILAGFLIAVITLIGDPKALPSGSWQIARLGSSRTYNRLIRHKWLFILYLVTLFLIFLSILLKKSSLGILLYLIEYIYTFLSCFAALLSFKLPSSLIELQRERIEQEISERRRAEGIDD